jgi:hypothetical protein
MDDLFNSLLLLPPQDVAWGPLVATQLAQKEAMSMTALRILTEANRLYLPLMIEPVSILGMNEGERQLLASEILKFPGNADVVVILRPTLTPELIFQSPGYSRSQAVTLLNDIILYLRNNLVNYSSIYSLAPANVKELLQTALKSGDLTTFDYIPVSLSPAGTPENSPKSNIKRITGLPAKYSVNPGRISPRSRTNSLVFGQK